MTYCDKYNEKYLHMYMRDYFISIIITCKFKSINIIQSKQTSRDILQGYSSVAIIFLIFDMSIILEKSVFLSFYFIASIISNRTPSVLVTLLHYYVDLSRYIVLLNTFGRSDHPIQCVR